LNSPLRVKYAYTEQQEDVDEENNGATPSNGNPSLQNFTIGNIEKYDIGKPHPENKLFIRNLPKTTSIHTSKGCGFVKFADQESASKAVEAFTNEIINPLKVGKPIERSVFLLEGAITPILVRYADNRPNIVTPFPNEPLATLNRGQNTNRRKTKQNLQQQFYSFELGGEEKPYGTVYDNPTSGGVYPPYPIYGYQNPAYYYQQPNSPAGGVNPHLSTTTASSASDQEMYYYQHPFSYVPHSPNQAPSSDYTEGTDDKRVLNYPNMMYYYQNPYYYQQQQHLYGSPTSSYYPFGTYKYGNAKKRAPNKTRRPTSPTLKNGAGNNNASLVVSSSSSAVGVSQPTTTGTTNETAPNN